MAADGSIYIDTKMDSGGFNTGVSSMVDGLKGLAGAIGVAFSVVAITNFLKTAASAASAMQVMENRFNGLFGAQTDYAKKQLSDLASKINMADDDLMSLAATVQNAFTALGFGGKQAADMSIKLTTLTEDLATFYGVSDTEMAQTMMMAMQGMTRGLKSLGISISETDIKNKAMTLGLYNGTGAISDQAKAQAIYALIVEKTTAAQGNAEKTAHTWAGEMRGLSDQWGKFTEAVGNSLIVFAPVLAYIHAILAQLTTFFETVAQIVGMTFGNTEDQAKKAAAGMNTTADAANNAATAQDNLANSTANSGKVAKGALASFDQLNVLQQAPATAAAADTGGGGVAPDLTPAADKTSAAMDTIKAKFAEVQKFLQPVTDAFHNLVIALTPLGQTIWAGLKWAWDNILVPLGKWAITDLLPHFLDLVAAAGKVLNSVLLQLQPAWDWLWKNIIEPAGEAIGKAIIDGLDWITAKLTDLSNWLNANPDLFKTWSDNIYNAFEPIANWFMKYVYNPIADNFGLLVTAVGDCIKSITNAPWWPVLVGTVTAILKAIASTFYSVFELIGGIVRDAIEMIAGIISGFILIISGILKFIIGSFTGDWKLAWSGLGDIVTGVFQQVYSVVRGVVNLIIDLINFMMRSVNIGMNAAISAIDSIHASIPSWVPGIGGQSWSPGIPQLGNAPQIPHLATGAVIPPNAAFAAILGDQKSGTNIEAPEALIRQIVREESRQTGQQNISISFGGTLGELVRLLKPQIDKENTRIGSSLISGGVVR